MGRQALTPRRRVAIDATLIGARTKGAGRVLRNLLRELPAADRDHEYVGLVTDDGARVLADDDTAILRTVSFRRGLSWELSGVARAALAAGADLLFTVRELTPRRRLPTVVHIFEPPIYRLRSGVPRSPVEAKHLAKDAVLAAMLRASVRRAAAVTAGSATTAEWLRAHTGAEARVVLPGIDPVFLSQEDPAPTGGAPFVLHPATGDRRENTDLVLRAWTSQTLADIELVLVGASSTERERLRAEIVRLGIESRVDARGWVTDEELRQLYRTAAAVLHPTKYEAYAGYPALEAMALGTPVIALAAPGATEALSGAAVLLEHETAEAIASAVAALVADPARRRALGREGRARARELTWDHMASELAAVFTDVLG